MQLDLRITLKQGRINVDATPWRRNHVDTTLFRRRVRGEKRLR